MSSITNPGFAAMFNEEEPTRIVLEDGGELLFFEHWLSPTASAHIFQTLLNEIPWVQKEITIVGKKVLQPRLIAWFGDPEAQYTYSGLRNVPIPWTPTLTLLKERAETDAQAHFNSVLANLYRNEKDSMGFHADNEKELGENPTIASVSFGETRQFQLRYTGKHKKVEGINLDLPCGSLLVMCGTTQHFYRHGVPKSKKPLGPRINLTFRAILKRSVD